MQKTNKIKQFRALDALYNEIKKIDPGTAISKNLLRTLGMKGEFDTIIVGKKRLYALDSVVSFFGICGRKPIDDKEEEK